MSRAEGYSAAQNREGVKKSFEKGALKGKYKNREMQNGKIEKQRN